MQGRPAGLSDDESDDEYGFSPPLTNGKHLRDDFVSSETSFPPAEKKLGSTDFFKKKKNCSVRTTLADLDDFKQAVIKGNCNAIRQALTQGVQVDQKLEDGWTGLLYSCNAARADAAALLIEKGADPNFQADGFTPLIAVCASSENNSSDVEKCVALLLEKSADPNACERHKMTPLMFASRDGRVDIVRKLVQAGADVNFQDYKNWTALTWACYKGHGIIARYLLENKADSLIVTTDGETAADLARMQNKEEIACLVETWYSKLHQPVLVKTNKDTSLPSGPSANTDLQPPRNAPDEKSKALDIKYYGELEIVLSGLGLQHLLPVLSEHSVDFVSFLRLDDDDLDRLNIRKVGERIKILDAIKQIHKQEWERSSLPAIHLKKHITCPDGVSLLGNIGKQTRYMQASIGYLHDKVVKQPAILEAGQEASDVQALLIQAQEAYVQTQGLVKKLGAVIRAFETLQTQSELKITDEIKRKKQKTSNIGTAAVLLSLSAAIGLAYLRYTR